MGRCKLHAVCSSRNHPEFGCAESVDARVRVSVGGTEAAQWDKDTWGPLADLARNHPEAGVHFQGIYVIHSKQVSR